MTGAAVAESPLPGAAADRGDAAVAADASGPQRHHSTTALQHYPTHPHPRGYVAYRADRAPSINGRLDDACWGAASWSDDFVDIEGTAKVGVCMHAPCVAWRQLCPHPWGT